LAAQRFKLDTVLIPEDNLQDLAEIPNEVLSSLKIIGISHVDQLLRFAFETKCDEK
jgi:ATP-dependent Lon protease